ncbi:MAG: hypothetical protein ACI3Y9_07740 [Candidatus Cryptobacteroides sp.]
MGFFKNIGCDRLISRGLAEIVRKISSKCLIMSDLDLYTTALSNLSSDPAFKVEGKVNLNAPFIVVKGFRYRVALFNEIVSVDCAGNDIAEDLRKQYQDRIDSFLSESHDMLENKEIEGYFAAILTERHQPEESDYYPTEDKFEYYYNAETSLNCGRADMEPCTLWGRSFRIVGETINN